MAKVTKEKVDHLTKRFDRLCTKMENLRLDITDLERDVEEANAPVKLPGMK